MLDFRKQCIFRHTNITRETTALNDFLTRHKIAVPQYAELYLRMTAEMFLLHHGAYLDFSV